MRSRLRPSLDSLQYFTLNLPSSPQGSWTWWTWLALRGFGSLGQRERGSKRPRISTAPCCRWGTSSRHWGLGRPTSPSGTPDLHIYYRTPWAKAARQSWLCRWDDSGTFLYISLYKRFCGSWRAWFYFFERCRPWRVTLEKRCVHWSLLKGCARWNSVLHPGRSSVVEECVTEDVAKWELSLEDCM